MSYRRADNVPPARRGAPTNQSTFVSELEGVVAFEMALAEPESVVLEAAEAVAERLISLIGRFIASAAPLSLRSSTVKGQ